MVRYKNTQYKSITADAIAYFFRLVGLPLLVVLLLYHVWGTPKDSQATAQPLINAIERYHQLHGSYPETLGTLTQEGLLTAIPTPPWDLWTRRDQFEYFVDRDLDFFSLNYDEQDYFGGLGPSKWKTRTYVSFQGKWNGNYLRGSPPLPLELAIKRAGERFRNTQSSDNLNMLAGKIIEYSDQGSDGPLLVWAEDVWSVLGRGETCEVDGRPGELYKAQDAHAAEYCFISRKGGGYFYEFDFIVEIFRLDRSESPPQW
ncbi:hypothetical protein V5E97_15020 [Singulisphaera sp. Ch08]|uniref:Uncharacterized protein n=1 Tax=Singulisphaera sp. Ch08 TaxID=3120278 RepID=A0AAU7CQM3_9BACT